MLKMLGMNIQPFDDIGHKHHIKEKTTACVCCTLLSLLTNPLHMGHQTSLDNSQGIGSGQHTMLTITGK